MITKGRQWNHKRTNYFVNKGFQAKYVLSYFLSVLFSNIILALAFAVMSSEDIHVLYEKYGIHINKTPMVLFAKILAANWYILAAILLVVIVVAIALTHRIAGPLARLENIMNTMAAGNFGDTISLRRRDEFHSLARELNKVNDLLTTRIAAMRQYTVQIDSQLASATVEIDNPELVQAAKGHLHKATELNTRMHDLLADFTIKHDA
jgi:methyl-accepting chemotaxis protein